MGTDTTYLQLYKPAIGETGWGTQVNDSFDDLAAAVAPFTATLYVRPTGSNANDGLSWAKAKKDILGAFDTLPVGGGRIRFESGSYVDATNTTRGLWIAGANDSNFSGTVPTGWRKQSGTLLLEGIPSIHGSGSRRPTAYLNGGSTTSTASPLFWFSGCDASIELRNIAMSTAMALPMELGKDSGTGLFTNNSGFVFDNILLTSDTGDASHGPTINATSTYWTYIRDSTLFANSAAAKGTTNRAVFYMPGASGSYHGLIWICDTNFNKGGGVIQKATSSQCTVTLDNIVQEAPGGGLSAPIFWWNALTQSTVFGVASLRGCQTADTSAGTDAWIKVTAGNPPSLVLADGAGGEGPYTYMGGGEVSSDPGQSPGSQRQVGIHGSQFVGKHDGHRRSFGPTAVKYPNLANQDTSVWSSLNGGSTVTTGITAPDGSANAARLSSASQQYRRVYNTARSLAVGDWVIAGVWARAHSGTWPTALPEVDWSSSSDLFDASVAGVNFFTLKVPWSASTKEWTWLSAAYKVTQATDTPATLIFFLFSDVGATMDYFAPVLLHIPTGTYDDAEVLETHRHLGTWSNNAIAGDVALMKGQALSLNGVRVVTGTLTPEGAVTAPPGSLFLRTDGGASTSLYVKTSGTGNTGWTAK